MSSIVAIKGFNDILPTQTPAWRRLEQHLASLMDAYGYQQIRLPIVEQTNLFKRMHPSTMLNAVLNVYMLAFALGEYR
jgi:histidyl-tRNA synthetase